jgi:Tfp pilus assembly protein PilF
VRKPLQTISAREFAGRFASGVRVSQQSFTWFLGAGCSKTSGILDAAGLVEKWLREQYELEANPAKAFNTWLKSNFASYDSENPAKHYAQAFARRHPSPVERQREIEIICARGEPAYGYATLAQLLSNKDYGRYCNTVLTTNFDDLIADALYLYGERHSRPLVVTHEALARYVRTNSPRPIIVKLHGDAHVDPKNLQPETRELDVALCKQLYPFLQDHALIFIGYGGNDESILKFVQNCPVPALAPPIFWVSKREAPAPFQDWLSERDALRVDLTDFDQLMHLIRNALGIELIDRRRWNQIGDTYYESFERLKKEIDKLTGTSDDTNALKLATTSAQRSLPDDWTLFSAAKELEVKSPDEADRIYREGLEKFPNSRALNNNYALFLRNVRQNMDAAEIQYKRALDVDPSNSFSLTSYAAFLQDVRKDFDAAEKHYKRAIEADPNDAYSLVRYAAFLNSVRNDTSAAELYYKRAVEAEPTYAFGLENYARFLERIRQDMDGAETYYKRAIEAAPADDYALESYALFLQNIRKNMDAAEVFHKRAVEADPTSPYALENYALFLQKIRKNMDAAEIFHKRAVEADPDSAYILGNYAYFLDHVRNEGDAAAIYYERANKADEP